MPKRCLSQLTCFSFLLDSCGMRNQLEQTLKPKRLVARATTSPQNLNGSNQFLPFVGAVKQGRTLFLYEVFHTILVNGMFANIFFHQQRSVVFVLLNFCIALPKDILPIKKHRVLTARWSFFLFNQNRILLQESSKRKIPWRIVITGYTSLHIVDISTCNLVTFIQKHPLGLNQAGDLCQMSQPMSYYSCTVNHILCCRRVQNNNVKIERKGLEGSAHHDWCKINHGEPCKIRLLT